MNTVELFILIVLPPDEARAGNDSCQHEQVGNEGWNDFDQES